MLDFEIGKELQVRYYGYYEVGYFSSSTKKGVHAAVPRSIYLMCELKVAAAVARL
jgi:hypothetical protein